MYLLLRLYPVKYQNLFNHFYLYVCSFLIFIFPTISSLTCASLTCATTYLCTLMYLHKDSEGKTNKPTQKMQELQWTKIGGRQNRDRGSHDDRGKPI